MTGLDSYTISLARPEDADGMNTVSVEAYKDDPLRKAVWPAEREHFSTPEVLREFRTKTFASSLKKKHSLAYKAVLKDQPDVIVGYAMWYRPGHFAKAQVPDPAVPEEKPKPRYDGEGAMDDEIPAAVDAEALKTYRALFAEKQKGVIGDGSDLWYLANVAVLPQYQGQGIASEMLRIGLQQVDEDGSGCFLSGSPRGVVLYLKFGFELKGEVDVKQVRVTSYMLREPRRPLSR